MPISTLPTCATRGSGQLQGAGVALAPLLTLADVRSGAIDGSYAAKAAGHHWAVSELQSSKSRVPVNGRWRGPAIDPKASMAHFQSSDRSTLEAVVRESGQEGGAQR